VERFLYRISGIDAHTEMTWETYAVGRLSFNIIGLIVVYVLQRLQVCCRSIHRDLEQCPRIPPGTQRSALHPIPTGRAMAVLVALIRGIEGINSSKGSDEKSG
jgi:K+-transporting ATPase A subunit